MDRERVFARDNSRIFPCSVHLVRNDVHAAAAVLEREEQNNFQRDWNGSLTISSHWSMEYCIGFTQAYQRCLSEKIRRLSFSTGLIDLLSPIDLGQDKNGIVIWFLFRLISLIDLILGDFHEVVDHFDR